MKTGRAFFCIIQDGPKPGSPQITNIGLLLICSDFHFIQAKFLANIERLKDAAETRFSPKSPESGPDQSLEAPTPARKSFRDLTHLKDFVASFSDGISLSASSPRKVTDPAAELSSLYDLYVARQHQPTAGGKQVSPLSCVAC